LGGIGNALDLGALPYFKYYLCAGPIREGLEVPSTLDLTLHVLLSLCGIGNALNLGPYPTTCTILVQDPLEGSEMASTLVWALLHVLSLYSTSLSRGFLKASVSGEGGGAEGEREILS